MNNYEKFHYEMSAMDADELRDFLNQYDVHSPYDLVKWLEEKEANLTVFEKKYLKDAIKFIERDNDCKVIRVSKTDYQRPTICMFYYLKFLVEINILGESTVHYVSLPPFPASTKKFRGMLRNEYYSLEELGINREKETIGERNGEKAIFDKACKDEC